MISRVAEHCFWLGRYLERTESAARVCRTANGLALDGDLPPAHVFGSCVTVSGQDEDFLERFGADARGEGERVQEYLVWDVENSASLLRSVMALRENARSIREVVSLETWEAINELYLMMQDQRGRIDFEHNRDGFFRSVRQSTQLILGAARNTMLHDNAFDFISLGVFLERIGQTARLLDVHHHALMQLPANLVVEESLWLSLLRACSGFEPFMKRNAGRVTPRAVASFLVQESKFPRSVRFCVHQADERLGNIRSPQDPILPKLASHSRLRLLDAYLAALPPGLDTDSALHELLTHVVEETAAICTLISEELLAVKPREVPPVQHQKQTQSGQSQTQA